MGVVGTRSLESEKNKGDQREMSVSCLVQAGRPDRVSAQNAKNLHYGASKTTLITTQNFKKNLHPQSETKIAKTLLTGTKPTYEGKKPNLFLVGCKHQHEGIHIVGFTIIPYIVVLIHEIEMTVCRLY